jgi:hypothetical protein
LPSFCIPEIDGTVCHGSTMGFVAINTFAR